MYALGVILYQLLSGRLPYALDAGNLRAIAESITTRPPERLERALAAGDATAVAHRLTARGTSEPAFRRFVRGDLWRIVQTALAKEPQRRYPSVARLSEDLRRLLDGRPVSVGGDTWHYRAGKFVQRNRAAVAMASIAVLAVAVGSGASLLQMRRAQDEARMARQAQLAMLRVLEQVGSTRSNADIARAILETGSAQLRQFPADAPARRELAETLVFLLWERGNYQLAESLTRDALGPRLSGHGLRDRHDMRMLVQYAVVGSRSGRLEQGRRALATALAEWPPDDSVERAELLGGASMIELVANQPEASYAHARAAYRMHERMAGPEGVEPHITMEYAASLTAQRRGQEARVLTEALLGRRFAPNEAGTQGAAQVMAALRRSLFGDFAGADQLYRRTDALLGDADAVDREFLTFSDAVNRFDLGQLPEAGTNLQALESGERVMQRRDLSAAGYNGRAEWRWLRGELSLAQGDAAGAARAFAEGAALLEREAGSSPGEDSGLHQRVYLHALHAIAARGRDAAAADAALARAQALAARPGVAGTYAQAMAEAAHGHALQARAQPAQAAEAFARAQAMLASGRGKPLVLEFQLKENRDALRLAAWEARAWQAAGEPARAAEASGRALSLAGELGASHPFAPVF